MLKDTRRGFRNKKSLFSVFLIVLVYPVFTRYAVSEHIFGTQHHKLHMVRAGVSHQKPELPFKRVQ